MDKKIKRQLELAGIKPLVENRINKLSNIDVIKKASDGKIYAIIRENRKYYIKTTNKTENLIESDFDYIGGVANKPKHSYGSFSDATKAMNFMFEQINENIGGDNINILKSDVELLDETKYVLKSKNKPKPEPQQNMGPQGDMGIDFGDMETVGDDDLDFGDVGGEEELDFSDDEDLDMDDEEDPIKGIQKTTGQLGQKLRDVEDLSSDMQKWVAKSVLSALDLDNMDNNDKKDLIKTIKKKPEGEEVEVESDVEMEESYDSYMEDDTKDPNIVTKEDLFGIGENYDSYMEDETGSDCEYCLGAGCSICGNGENLDPKKIGSEYGNYMEDEDLSTGRGGEKYDRDELLFDDMFRESKKQRKTITEDHFNDKMTTKEQLKSYLKTEKMVEEDGFTLEWCHEEETENGTVVFLNIKDSGEEVMKIRIEPNGDVDMGYDDLDEGVDNLEIDDEILTLKNKEMNKPAPTKEPGIKEPGTKEPTKPSRRPFTPPPNITPGEEPKPKAKGGDDLDIEFE